MLLRTRVVGFVAATVEVASSLRVVLGSTGDLASELLKSLALGLGDEKRSEDTAQHEEGEDLDDVVQPWRGVGGSGTADTERTDQDLGDDGTDLS